MHEIENLDWYQLQARILPQPLAFAVGRIARADGLSNQVDCIRRAAETLSRYVAIAQVASIAYRNDQELESEPLIEIPDNYSWGSFNDVSRRVSKMNCRHPLRNSLVKGMGLKKQKGRNRNSVQPSAIDHLDSFVQTRNIKTSHSLVGLDDHKALELLQEHNWDESLRNAVEAFDPLLNMPLIVITGGKYIRRERVSRYRVLHYKGEGDPFPINVCGKSGLIEENTPYMVNGHDLISLAPGMVVDSWAPHRTGLYFIDGFNEGKARYRTIYNDDFRYREESDKWPTFNWCDPEDRERIDVTTENKNLRMLLSEDFKNFNLKLSEVTA